MQKKMSSEQAVWAVVRIGLLVIYAVVVYKLLAGECGGADVADKGWFSCRFTGNFADWFGLIIFILCGLWVADVYRMITKKDVYSPAKSIGWAGLWFLLTAGSLLLIWNV